MKRSELRIGIVGTSAIAHKFADAAKSSGCCRLVAVYSRTLSVGREFACAEGDLRVENDFERFVSAPDLDAVYVASPNAIHYEQAREAIAHGKHVICEKPTTSCRAELDDLMRQAESRGLVFMEAMRPLHAPAFSVISENLAALGKIRRVHFEYCQYSSRYDRFRAGELPNAFNPALSNAAIMDIGVYPIAVLVALFGSPDHVSSASVFLHNGFEGSGELLCRYGDDMLASVAYSKISDSVAPSVITGEKGSLIIDRISATESLTLALRGMPERELAFERVENDMVYEVRDFCAAVFGEKDPRFFSDCSMRTIELLDLARSQNGICFPADQKG